MTLSKFLTKDAVVLALIPLAGSLISVTFEAGYLSFYGAPATLVHLDLPQIVTASLFVAVVLAVLIAFFEIVIAIVRGKHPVRRSLASPLSVALFGGPFIAFIHWPSTKWWWFFGFILILAILELIPPLFAGSGSYVDRLSAKVASDDRHLNDMSGKEDRNLSFIKTALAFLIFGSFLVYLVGRDYAEKKSGYFVLDGSNDILVTNYGDVMVLKSYNPTTKEIGNDLLLMKVDSSKVRLSYVFTGPLLAAKMSNK